MIRALTISGFRGFGEPQSIQFSIPKSGKDGSGLTVITGANNSGKTTIIEAIRAFIGNEPPSFSEGKRNIIQNGIVTLSLIEDNGSKHEIRTIDQGGSSTNKSDNFSPKYYVVQSRRYINYEFNKQNKGRDLYISQSLGLTSQRTATLSGFESRLFEIQKHKKEFDIVIERVLGDKFNWIIEQHDSGSYYLKYTYDQTSHSSEGMGDGVWSIFTICAAFYDAKDGDTIVIDEPELSLHPMLQKRLMQLFIENASRMQIIISTHSPYFVSWEAILNGGSLLRICKVNNSSCCYAFSDECRKNFEGLKDNLNNPHVLGLDANEVFFLEDKVLLVEGQEDVVIYKKIAKDLQIDIKGNFFGWGVGGASNMKAFMMLFKDLGYKHLVAIFDGDKKEDAEKLKPIADEYKYKIMVLKKDDIRDKKQREIPFKEGVTDDKGNIKDEYKSYMSDFIKGINDYLNGVNTTEFAL